MKQINRRNFISSTALAGAGIAFMPQSIKAMSAAKKEKIRAGIIAVGLRGQLHLEEMLKRSDVEVNAIADPDKGMIAMAQKLVKQYNKKPRQNTAMETRITRIY
jgi:uncharacterized protein (DUF1501 family)